MSNNTSPNEKQHDQTKIQAIDRMNNSKKRKLSQSHEVRDRNNIDCILFDIEGIKCIILEYLPNNHQTFELLRLIGNDRITGVQKIS